MLVALSGVNVTLWPAASARLATVQSFTVDIEGFASSWGTSSWTPVGAPINVRVTDDSSYSAEVEQQAAAGLDSAERRAAAVFLGVPGSGWVAVGGQGHLAGRLGGLATIGGGIELDHRGRGNHLRLGGLRGTGGLAGAHHAGERDHQHQHHAQRNQPARQSIGARMSGKTAGFGVAVGQWPHQLAADVDGEVVIGIVVIVEGVGVGLPQAPQPRIGAVGIEIPEV